MKTRRLGFLVLLVGLAACSGPVGAHLPTAEPDASRGGGLLQPGDIIKLNVWREPEWSGEFPVDEFGVAVLPRLGAIKVTQMTPAGLKRFLVDSMGRYLRNPSIDVIPLRRIQVLGAVRSPGLYPVAPTVTVGDVVAIAGGATAEGKSNQVVLRRGGKDLRVRLDKATRLADTPIRTGDQLYVPQRSWISRNVGLFGATLSAATTLVVALIIR